MCGIRRIADGLVEEFKRVLPRQRKTQRENLALLTATMLDVRSANLMDLAAALPREADRTDMRYQWISRVLGNELIDPDAVMEPFAREVLARASADGGPVVLIMDQSKLSDRHQVLMLALRHGERALPLAWRVEATAGPIGFETQKELLEAVAPWLPEGVPVFLMADRFYGTADLISLCQGLDWDYRLRLKGNLVVGDGGERTKTGALADDHVFRLEGVQLTAKKATTNIGIIRDPGHDEAWIIAMSDKPGYAKTLDYSKRWGSSRCSPISSRAASASKTHTYPAPRPPRPPAARHGACALLRRLDRPVGHRTPSNSRRKKLLSHQPKKIARSKTSWFTRGLRRIAKLLQAALPLPPLWST